MVETQPQLQPALLRLSAIISESLFNLSVQTKCPKDSIRDPAYIDLSVINENPSVVALAAPDTLAPASHVNRVIL